MINRLLSVHLYAEWQILILVVLAYVCGIFTEKLDNKIKNRKNRNNSSG